MADKSSLKVIGAVFASLTLAVTLVAATLVHKARDGERSLAQPPAFHVVNN